MTVPRLRIRTANQAPVNAEGDFVLYWMTAFRRPYWNFSLQRAVEHARELKKPLIVVEALEVGHKWASDRSHHFVIQGMADNQRAFSKTRVVYYPYLEQEAGAGHRLLDELA
ncbi:MAG: deoxyribodipyrimidine photolyase, partial [Planctomycetaceae bacterium]|nr:deoxyribodipyrimidine photolyase [Planctomycetaceae bacterium]